VTLHDRSHSDGRAIDLVWTGTLERSGSRSAIISIDLRRADFVPKVGELERTPSDASPLPVIGNVTAIGERWLEIDYSSIEDTSFRIREYAFRLGPPGEEPIWRLERVIRETHGDPDVPFDPPNPYVAFVVEELFGTPNIDKTLLFQAFSSYHQLPEIAPYVNDPKFQGAIHLQTIDHTDFGYYRRHPKRLRVVNKVLDAISLAETEFRANAYRSTFSEKAAFYQKGLSDGLVGPHGMVVRSISPEGMVQPELDSALWTGIYVYTQSLRYQTEGETEALDNVRHSLRGLLTLMDITGDPATFARTLRPIGPPLEGGWHRGLEPFDTWDWLEGGNNDMAKGLALGMIAGWQVLPGGDPLRNEIAQHALGLLQLRVFQPDTAAELPGVNPGIAWLLAGISNKDPELTERGLQWFNQEPLRLLAQYGGGPVYVFGLSDWSGNHLNAVGTLIIQQLLEHTDDPTLRDLWRRTPGTAWQALRSLNHPLHAALALASHALKDPADVHEATEQAIWALRGFPAPKPPYDVDYGIRDDYVPSPFPALPWKLDWLTANRWQVIKAPPMVEHKWDEYLWNDQHFSPGDPGVGDERVPGVDYLFLYWVVRAGNVIPPRSLCETLANGRGEASWIDLYGISGIAGETVKISLIEDTTSGSARDGKAALTIIDSIAGVNLHESRHGPLPLEMRLDLPATGKYWLVVTRDPTGPPRAPFEDNHCLTVSSSEEAALTLANVKAFRH
jgi:hypothetical protein